MSPKERRAFASGYRFALRKARKELYEMRERLDDEIAALDDKMQAAREQMAQQLDAEIGGLMDEMQRTRTSIIASELSSMRLISSVTSTRC